jgi:hypothetical protein
VLDVLAAEGVKGSFFINIDNTIDVRNNPAAQDILKRIVNEGHELASHTADHARGADPSQGIAAFDDARIEGELSAVEELVKQAGINAPLTVRVLLCIMAMHCSTQLRIMMEASMASASPPPDSICCSSTSASWRP